MSLHICTAPKHCWDCLTEKNQTLLATLKEINDKDTKYMDIHQIVYWVREKTTKALKEAGESL